MPHFCWQVQWAGRFVEDTAWPAVKGELTAEHPLQAAGSQPQHRYNSHGDSNLLGCS